MSTTTYFDNERIERAVLAELQSSFPAALVTVAARWVSVDPETLPSVVTWGNPGYDPTAIEKNYDYYPYVEVLAGDRSPSDDPGARTDQWAGQEQQIPVTVSFIVVAADVETVNKVAKRYSEALDLVLQESPLFAAETGRNYKQRNRAPIITLSLPGRHSKYNAAGNQGGDMFSEDDEDWMIAGTLETTVYG